jgi:hypothetical protein
MDVAAELTTSSDHLGFVLKADDGNFDRNAIPLHGP